MEDKNNFKRSLRSVRAKKEFPVNRKGSRVGHMTTLTSDKIKVLCTALKKGHKKTQACWLIGMSSALFNQSMKKGEADYDKLQAIIANGVQPHTDNYTIFAELFVEVQKAVASMQEGPIRTWLKAAKGDWKAAEAFLKRSLPDEWDVGKNQQQVINNTSNTQTLIVVPPIAKSKDDWEARTKERKESKNIEIEAKVISEKAKLIRHEKRANPIKSTKKPKMKVLPRSD